MLGLTMAIAVSACSSEPAIVVTGPLPTSTSTSTSTSTPIAAHAGSGPESSGESNGESSGESNGESNGATDGGSYEPDLSFNLPTVQVAAMATPIPIIVYDDVPLAAVTTRYNFDETGRELLTVEITTRSTGSVDDLAALLDNNPPLPIAEHGRGVSQSTNSDIVLVDHGTPAVALPTDDHYYDWSRVTSWVTPLPDGNSADGNRAGGAGDVGGDLDDGSRSVAITSISTRRQSKNVGTGIHRTALARPLLDVLADGPRLGPSSSSMTWRPEQPDVIDVSLLAMAFPEHLHQVLAWIERRAVPGTREEFDGGGTATLAATESLPEIAVRWIEGNYRIQVNLQFRIPAAQ